MQSSFDLAFLRGDSIHGKKLLPVFNRLIISTDQFYLVSFSLNQHPEAILFEKPIFITGCTNTGTKCLFFSLLEHPDLGGIRNELHWYGIQPNLEGRLNRLFALWPCFNTNYHNGSSLPASYGTGPLDKAGVEATIKSVFKCFPNKCKQGKRLLFKDPKLSLRTGWIKKLWPDATIIITIRNPWSVCEGIRRKLPLMGDVPLNLDIPTAAAQYNNVYHSLLIDTEGLDDVIFVKYEDLISASTFPDGDTFSNEFWLHILSHANLSRNFTIPNASPFSNLEKGRDEYSLGNLSPWDIEFISRCCRPIIDTFHYRIPSTYLEDKHHA